MKGKNWFYIEAMRILVLLCLILSAHVHAQLTCFSLVEGPSITCVEEDEQFIWLGTETEGLIRVTKADNSLEYFNMLNSDLPSNEVRSLLIYDAALIIALDSSIYSYDFIDFSMYIESFSGELAQGDEGQLIVAGNFLYREYVSSLVAYEKDLFELEDLHFSCDQCEYTSSVSLGLNGEVWLSHFGFYEFDILRYDGDDWTVFDSQNTDQNALPVESFDRSNQILSTVDGVFSTTWGGMSQFVDDDWQLFHNPQLTSGISNAIDTMYGYPIAMALDQDEGYWVGGRYDGWNMLSAELAYFDGVSWQIFNPFVDDTSFIVMKESSYTDELIYAGTSNGLVIINKSCLVTGLIELTGSDLLLYPNPAQDYVYLDSDILPAGAQVLVYDEIGRVVLQLKFNPIEPLDVHLLSNGFYTLHLRTNDGTYTAALSIQR